MIRDPFYRDIITRLDGKLDPDLFEQCAGDILRKIYPTLVPVQGGKDTGMDGAIGDTEGFPIPLITTTKADVIGNFPENLKSYDQGVGLSHKVVLATFESQCS